MPLLLLPLSILLIGAGLLGMGIFIPMLPALAQNTDTYFATPGGGGVNGSLGLCLNASAKAVPCNDPTAAPSPVVGNVGGYDISPAFTPTVQNAAYSSGNAIGGLQTITTAFRTAARNSGILNNVSVWSKGGATTPLTFYIFEANPSASTCTDKSAFVLGAADIAKLVPTTPPVLTPAVVGAGATATSASQQSPLIVQNLESTTNLYICIVVGGTVTPATTTDLVYSIGIAQD
jgi:hypothetical protein